MQQSRHKSSYSQQVGHYDSIIRIHIIRSDSLDACTCGGLYCSAKPLPMGFTLPHTRLAFKHLRPLSYQRLGSFATLTTWVSLLYMRLTDPLEFPDAILTWILILIIYNYTPPWDLPTRLMELRLSHWNHVPHTITTTFIPNIQFSHYHTINQQYHAINQSKHTNFNSYKLNSICSITYFILSKINHQSQQKSEQ